MAEAEKIKFVLLLSLLVIETAAINKWQGRDLVGGLAQLPSIQLPQSPPPPPKLWAAQENPTRAKSLPADLSFAADSNGNYQWVETIHPGEDVAFNNLSPRHSFSWSSSASNSILEIALQKLDGSFVSAIGGINPAAMQVRFRIKPGIQQDDEIHFSLTRLEGFDDADSRKTDWPIDWKPVRSVSEPNDRERSPLVKEAFERYATGKVTLDNLRHFFAEHNVHTRNDKMLTRGHITKMLSNPFYYGHFRYVGEVHEGTHEPLISKRLYDQAQAVLKSRYKWSPNHTPVKPKAFLGLLHCSTCGGAITAEMQKGHIYYRCTKKSRATTWCLQPYIREEDLDKEITGLLKPYSLRADWADEMLTRVKEEKTRNAQSARLMADQKRAEIGKLNLRLQTLLDSFLDGIIDREAYVAEKAKGMSQKKSLEEQSSALLKGRADWLEPFQKWILTAKNAGEIAIEGSLEEKRVLAQQVFGSNLVLDCKKARGSCVKPWSLLSSTSQTGGMVPTTGLEPV